MPYLYHTEEDRREMLEALGLRSEDDLFDRIPEKFRLKTPLPVGEGKPEHETIAFFEKLAAKNRPAGAVANFLGGGVYDHVVPAVVKHLSSRPEFYTAYTPYQPEVSQGTLQMIFEYQTMISRLTALPVANASMYDGATALAEAALMAVKITKRRKLLVSESVNPRYRRVIATYAGGQGLAVEPVPVGERGDIDAAALRSALSDDVAALLLQTPNYFGVLECPWEYVRDVKDRGALLVVAVDPVSLSVLKPPGEYDADIAVGEGQSLGNEMNFGGPLLGFMACKSELVRNLPGRLVSETRDVEGRRAYVLTLQTREQHIRREKATSNICTNQGLVALRATIYLSLLGAAGFEALGRICHDKAVRLARRISGCRGYALRFDGPFFREFVVRCPVDAEVVVEKARRRAVLAGIPLGGRFGEDFRRDLLVAVTEKRTDEEFDALCEALESV